MESLRHAQNRTVDHHRPPHLEKLVYPLPATGKDNPIASSKCPISSKQLHFYFQNGQYLKKKKKMQVRVSFQGKSAHFIILAMVKAIDRLSTYGVIRTACLITQIWEHYQGS